MITNERQYRITRSWLERFEQARGGVEEQRGKLHPRAQQALRDQHDSQVEELRAQLAKYEALRRGDVTVLELDSLDELPEALIRAHRRWPVSGGAGRAPRPEEAASAALRGNPLRRREL